jgi:hypothetical protein
MPSAQQVGRGHRRQAGTMINKIVPLRHACNMDRPPANHPSLPNRGRSDGLRAERSHHPGGLRPLPCYGVRCKYSLAAVRSRWEGRFSLGGKWGPLNEPSTYSCKQAMAGSTRSNPGRLVEASSHSCTTPRKRRRSNRASSKRFHTSNHRLCSPISRKESIHKFSRLLLCRRKPSHNRDWKWLWLGECQRLYRSHRIPNTTMHSCRISSTPAHPR